MKNYPTFDEQPQRRFLRPRMGFAQACPHVTADDIDELMTTLVQHNIERLPHFYAVLHQIREFMRGVPPATSGGA